MTDKKNINKDYERGEYIKMLMDASQVITACGKKIQKEAATITMSCHTSGTKGEAHKSLLFTKADEMKNLAELYNSVASRWKDAARKLASGIPKDKVMQDVLSYNTFFGDQLKSEKSDFEFVLNMLQKNGTARNTN